MSSAFVLLERTTVCFQLRSALPNRPRVASPCTGSRSSRYETISLRVFGSLGTTASSIRRSGRGSDRLRRERAERWAGYAVVLAIFVSACVALFETIDRLIHPQEPSHLWARAAAGAIGLLGDEIAARVRLRAGARLDSPALVADGNHARADGFVSFGVVASAVLVALGWEVGDPIVGLLITLVILKVTWNSWRTIRGRR